MILAFFIAFSCISEPDLPDQAAIPTSTLAKPEVQSEKLEDDTGATYDVEEVINFMSGYVKWFDENEERIISEIYSEGHCDPFFNDCQN